MREVGEASVLSSVWAMASKGDPLVVSLLPRHGGKAQWARPVGVCIVQWGCVPKGEGTQEPRSIVKVPSRVSVDFSVNPAWVSRAATPCGKAQCG